MRSLVSTTTGRLAIVAGVLLLLAAAGAVLLPSKPGGYACGSVAFPKWTDEQSEEIIDGAADIYDRLGSASYGSELRSQAAGLAYNAQRANRSCEEARSTRTVVAASTGGAALLIPAAILFVAGGRRSRDEVDAG